MSWRYDLFVTRVAGRWRVSVLDDVEAVPERVCDLADHDAALQFARGLAEDMTGLGDEVALHGVILNTLAETGIPVSAAEEALATDMGILISA